MLPTFVPVVPHVPQRARIHWSHVVTEALEEFVSRPTEWTLCKLLILAKTVLLPACQCRGGKRDKSQTPRLVLRRVQRFRDGEAWPLWREVMPLEENRQTPRPTGKPEDQKDQDQDQAKECKSVYGWVMIKYPHCGVETKHLLTQGGGPEAGTYRRGWVAKMVAGLV